LNPNLGFKNLDNNTPIKNIKIANSYYAWNPNWQWLKEFKNNSPNTKITKELLNLCEKKNFNIDKKSHEYIGYFNTTQGSEFDYIFVHIPKMFFWNKNEDKIDVNLSDINHREMKSQIWATDKIKDANEKERKINLNKEYFLNRLFINLTRGVRGCFVFIEDPILKKFITKNIR